MIEVESEPNRDVPLWLDDSHYRGRLFGGRMLRGDDIPWEYHEAVARGVPDEALREAAALIYEAASFRVERDARLTWASAALRGEAP